MYFTTKNKFGKISNGFGFSVYLNLNLNGPPFLYVYIRILRIVCMRIFIYNNHDNYSGGSKMLRGCGSAPGIGNLEFIDKTT